MFQEDLLIKVGDKIRLMPSLIDDDMVADWYDSLDDKELTIISMSNDASLIWVEEGEYALNIDYVIKADEEVIENIVMDDVFFTFDKGDTHYTVHAYAQDKAESDEYTVEVRGHKEVGSGMTLNYNMCYYCDSCGGLTDDALAVANDSILTFVHSTLFNERTQSIVKGF